MNMYKHSGKIAGILFLIAIATYMAGDGLIRSVVDAHDNIAQLSLISPKMTTGGILLLINSVAVILISAMLYPIVGRNHKTIALAYFGFRIAESVILIIGIVCILSLNTPVLYKLIHIEYHSSLITMVNKINHLSFQIAMIMLGMGSVLLCYALYTARLVPKPIAVWGLLGYALLIMGSILELYGYNVGVILAAPGGVFEIFIAIWLIVKGFNRT